MFKDNSQKVIGRQIRSIYLKDNLRNSSFFSERLSKSKLQNENCASHPHRRRRRRLGQGHPRLVPRRMRRQMVKHVSLKTKRNRNLQKTFLN